MSSNPLTGGNAGGGSSGSGRRAACPQCRTPYTVDEPTPGIIVRLGDRALSVVNAASPVLAGSFVGFVTWAGLGAYGAYTFVHVCGEDGLYLMQVTHPVKLFMIMPLIPISLVAFRLRSAMRVRVQVHANINGHNGVAGLGGNAGQQDQQQGVGQAAGPLNRRDEDILGLPDLTSSKTMSRLVVGGLLFPYVSSFVGRICFGFFNLHPLDRTILGAMLFEGTKTILQYAYTVEKRKLLQNRRILCYAH